MILVGDIGGTNTRLALAEIGNGTVKLHHRRQFPNADAAGLEALIDNYLADVAAPMAACLAVAGPTDGCSVRLTNLDWQIDANRIGSTMGFACRLVNDFEAIAWGVDAVTENHLVTLQAGEVVGKGSRLVIGPGTGLGVAIGVPGEAGHRPLAGEGGHIGFAPVDEEQSALLRFLQAKYGRVSVERILSGPGLADLYAFCRTASGRPVKRQREPAEVTEAALADKDPTASWTMRLFCRILGQTAGDLALVAGARDGIYLAGGIPPRILPFLKGPAFLSGLRDKGRFSNWITTLPVQVVTDPDIGLKGAALATRCPAARPDNEGSGK